MARGRALWLRDLRATRERLDRSEWLPAEELERWQRRQLARLLAHARAHVPYYAEMLASFPAAAGEVDADAWRALPSLAKATLRREGERLKSRAQHGRQFDRWTSGSTGEPTHLIKDTRYLLVFIAIRLRFLRSLGTDFRGKLLEIRARDATSTLEAPKRSPHWEAPWPMLFPTGEWVRASVLVDAAIQAEMIEREQPRYLVLNPSYLRLLLRQWRKSGRRVASLRYIRTQGEQLDPALRQECREVLGVPLYDVYGATEADYIALQCPAHDHYHVQSELNLVEVLTQDGRPCRAGETGRVVVTPLHSFSMPLLRYETGDYAEVGAPCPCGRGLPVLTRILGKERALLVLPTGQQRVAITGGAVFSKMEVVRQFQVAQTGPAEVEARVVAARPLDESERARIVQGLGEQLGPQFSVRIKLVDSIPHTRGGKYMEFVVDMPDQDQADRA